MPLPIIHYLYPSKVSLYHQKDCWALMTGASDGIGKALSHELASQGFNVVLHGRNAAKLTLVQDELKASHPKRSFQTVTCDASSFIPTDITRITTLVSSLPGPLTLLVNNVGGTAPLSSNFKHFEDTAPTEMTALFSLNTLFPMQLTNALLPMLARQPSRTLVLTCGSQAHIGQAYMAVYSACKAAIHAWSRSLAAEQHAAKSRIDILEVVIAGTYTQQLAADPNMSPGLFMPMADVMARSVLRRAGHGHRSVVAYWWHWVQSTAVGWLPGDVLDGILAGLLEKSVEGGVKRS